MSFRKICGLLVGLFFVCSSSSWAWAPTHKVESSRGRVYLRVLETDGVLFYIAPKQESATAIVEDSLLWDPDFIKAYSSYSDLTELKIGEPLQAGPDSQVFCFLDPVSGRLTLEVRFKDAGESNTRRIVLEATTEKGPYSQVLGVRAPSMDHLYGLGEQFPAKYLGDGTSDWKGRLRH